MELYNVKTSAQSLADGVAADISFGEADTIDKGNWHDHTGSPDTITVPTGKSGVYDIDLLLVLGNITADTQLQVSANSIIYDSRLIKSGGYNYLKLSAIAYLAAGTSFKFNVKQSGIVAGLNINHAELRIILVGKTLTL